MMTDVVDLTKDDEEKPERKEWVRSSRSAQGKTTITVTLQEDNVSTKYSCWTHGKQLTTGLAEARAGATKALDQLLEALRA